jgi:hypothetical protein
MNFFLLTDLRDRRSDESAPHQDPDEVLAVREFPLEEVRRMIAKGDILDMKTAVGMTLMEGRGKG